MKKTISILITTLIILSSLTVFASATGNNEVYTYEVNNMTYSIEFEDDNFSDQKKEAISAKLIGIENATAVPANIWCDIFGHDLVSSTVTVTEHKVRTYAPRCLKHTYDVTACEDCDYSEQTLLASTYTNCCAED